VWLTGAEVVVPCAGFLLLQHRQTALRVREAALVAEAEAGTAPVLHARGLTAHEVRLQSVHRELLDDVLRARALEAQRVRLVCNGTRVVGKVTCRPISCPQNTDVLDSSKGR
jgi:hypothetical protein